MADLESFLEMTPAEREMILPGRDLARSILTLPVSMGAAVVSLAVVMLASSCAYTTVTLAPTVPPNAEASVVLADDGTLLTLLHAGENRTEISIDDVPPHVQNAVVAIEDRRFWSHTGIDLRAIIRAARNNLDEGAVVFIKDGRTAQSVPVERGVMTAETAFEPLPYLDEVASLMPGPPADGKLVATGGGDLNSAAE